MKSTALFVLFCLCVSTFAQMEFAQIEQSEFGKTLLETVQIKLESNEPVGTLMNMLTGMAKELANDQDHADGEHASFQKECNNDIKQYENDIKRATERIAQLEKDLASNRPKLTKALEDLKSAQEKLAVLNQQLASAIEQRAKEAEEYKLKVEEHQKAVIAVGEAKKLFQGLVAQQTKVLGSVKKLMLAEQVGIFTQVSSSLRSAANEIESPKYKGILNILATISEKAPVQADQGVVQKIVDLCTKIIENINKSAEYERAAEGDRIKAFEQTRDSLQRAINGTKANISNLEILISTLRNQIASDEKSLAETQNTLKLKRKELADRVNECNNETTAYVADRQKRTSERNIVDQVINIVQSRLSTLRSYLKERVQNVA